MTAETAHCSAFRLDSPDWSSSPTTDPNHRPPPIILS